MEVNSVSLIITVIRENFVVKNFLSRTKIFLPVYQRLINPKGEEGIVLCVAT